MKRILFIVSALMALVATAASAQGIYFPSGGQHPLRFNGYSDYVNASASYSSLTPASLTFSLWLAPETYPMMNVAEAQTVPTYSMVAGNYDATAKTGFGLFLNSQGGYKFAAYISGQSREYTVSDDIIPLGEWSQVVVTMDVTGGLKVYRQGKPVTAVLPNGQTLYRAMNLGSASFLIGKSREALMAGPFHINTFNGLIDCVAVENGVRSAEDIASTYAQEKGGFTLQPLAVGESFPDNHLRPRFHAMPAKCWTNETHGMVFWGGKYHLFFQKNGNGPYMARLHWGHLTSSDLMNWSEEKVAIAPGASQNGLEANDGKGCWSGCVFQDADINGGRPTILYTGVSNAKAYIWQACPKDDGLLEWEKQGVLFQSAGNPCTADCSDDFRDPYFFAHDGQKYIIVGSSNKQQIGTCVLYKKVGSAWQYQGLFFSGTDRATCGRFWEMPNVTPMGNGKYLFTCTPLDASMGVRTIYWIGTIGSNGRFIPQQSAPQTFEMGSSSHDGYGLLSPTLCQNAGRMLCLGIVPDKVAESVNRDWGWAHNYSLPREVELSADGKSLLQRPAFEATDYRGREVTEGRQLEMLATFQYAAGRAQGFRFLISGDNYAELRIADGKVTVDLTKLPRIDNDGWSYNGLYEAKLQAANGEKVELHAFLDGSILDVFVNDREAFSVRILPTDAAATGVTAFSPLPYTAHVWEVAYQDDPVGLQPISCRKDVQAPGLPYCYNLGGQRVSPHSHGVVVNNGRLILNKN